MRAGTSLLALAVALAAPASSRADDARWLALLSLRPMAGGGVIVPDAGPVRGEFALDVTAGVRVFRQRRGGRAWLLGPELGFSPVTRGDDVTVLWHFGAVFGYGSVPLHVAWAPRFVVGAVDRGDVLGVRNGLQVTALAGLGCMELSHQWLRGDAGDEHDVRLTVGVDVGMLVHRIMASASGFDRW